MGVKLDPRVRIQGKGQSRVSPFRSKLDSDANLNAGIPDWELLARYLAGEAGMSERAQVERWIALDPANAAFLAALQRAWEASRATHTVDVDAAWTRVATRLNETASLAQVTASRRITFARPTVLAMAAALLLMAAVGIWRVLAPGAPVPASHLSSRTATYTTPVGRTEVIRLPDSSLVVLGPASQMVYDPATFTQERSVTLDGVAYFEVRHDSTAPFSVRAAGTLVRDLGTAFEVRARAADSVLRVVVREGAVEIQAEGGANSKVRLEAGDVARLDLGTGSIERQSHEDIERLLGWLRGELIFDDAPLIEVARELARWYGVEFRFLNVRSDELHYSGTFQLGSLELLDAGLQALDMAVPGVGVTRAGSMLTFEREGPAR